MEWTDPRGPTRGPSAVEWEVVAAYKTIESITAASPPVSTVDQSLAHLESYAAAHPDNPYIQELYLKGLRVAAYYADMTRAATLRDRFEQHAALHPEYEGVLKERQRFEEQDARFEATSGRP